VRPQPRIARGFRNSIPSLSTVNISKPGTWPLRKWPTFAPGRRMCFEFQVTANVPRGGRARPAAHWLRLLALVLTLLGLAVQQRVLTPAVRPSTGVVRLVAPRVKSLETQAVRAEPAVRVAATPMLARVPLLTQPIIAQRQDRVELGPALPPPGRCCASVSHFHSKRRIPRMNSEEPPRA
jgi:hypothetical protein